MQDIQTMLERYDELRLKLLALMQSDVGVQIAEMQAEVSLLEDTIKAEMKNGLDIDGTPKYEFKKSISRKYDYDKFKEIVGEEVAKSYAEEKIEYKIDSKKFLKDIEKKVLPAEAYAIVYDGDIRISVKERVSKDITL